MNKRSFHLIYKTADSFSSTRKKLKDWQIQSFRNVQSCIQQYGIAIHSGAMGSGKTIISGEVAVFLNMSLFIVRPKAVSGSWKEAACTQHLQVVNDCTYERLAGTSLYELFSNVTNEEIEASPLLQVTRRKELADGFLCRVETRTYQAISPEFMQNLFLEDDEEEEDSSQLQVKPKTYRVIQEDVGYEVTEKWKECVRQGVLLIADECQKSRNDNFFLKAFCCLSASLMEIRKTAPFSRARKSGILLLSASPMIEKKQILPILCMLCLWPVSWMTRGNGHTASTSSSSSGGQLLEMDPDLQEEEEEEEEGGEPQSKNNEKSGSGHFLYSLLHSCFELGAKVVNLKHKKKKLYRPQFEFKGDLQTFISFCSQFQDSKTTEIVQQFQSIDLHKLTFVLESEQDVLSSLSDPLSRMVGSCLEGQLFEFKNGSFPRYYLHTLSCRHVLIQLLFSLSSQVLFPSLMQWCINPETSSQTLTPDIANGFYHFANPEDLQTYIDWTQTIKSKQSDQLLDELGLSVSSTSSSTSTPSPSQPKFSLDIFQKIEKLRLSILVRLAQQKLKEDPEGKVVIGVWFLESLKLLESSFETSHPTQWKSMSGQSTESHRNAVIDSFQKASLNTRILLLTMKAAARGINLHDLHGKRIRYFFGSPGIDFDSAYQVTGRFVRTGAQSRAFIRFVYVALPSIVQSVTQPLSPSPPSSASSSSSSTSTSQLEQVIRENMENRWGLEISILNAQAKKSSVLEQVLLEQNQFQKENNLQGIPLPRDFPQEIELTFGGPCVKTEPYHCLLEKEIQLVMSKLKS